MGEHKQEMMDESRANGMYLPGRSLALWTVTVRRLMAGL